MISGVEMYYIIYYIAILVSFVIVSTLGILLLFCWTVVNSDA